MNNNLTTINQNAKLALLKSKNLINIANSILANSKNTTSMQNFENFRFHPTFGHQYSVYSVAITPDGKTIVSGSDDNTLKLWDLHSGVLHASFVSFLDDEWLIWKPNGDYTCSNGAYQHFCFLDESKKWPEAVDINHPVYKAKKKEMLLSDLSVTTPIDHASTMQFNDTPDIDDEMPF